MFADFERPNTPGYLPMLPFDDDDDHDEHDAHKIILDIEIILDSGQKHFFEFDFKNVFKMSTISPRFQLSTD